MSFSRPRSSSIYKDPPRTRQRTLILAAFLPWGGSDDTVTRRTDPQHTRFPPARAAAATMPRNTADPEHRRHRRTPGPHAGLSIGHPRCSDTDRPTLNTMSDIIIPGIGSLEPVPALDHLDLLAPPVAAALTALAERGVPRPRRPSSSRSTRSSRTRRS